MENDREVNQVLMNIKNASGSIISASLLSVRLTFLLATYLARLVQKGLLASKAAHDFEAFVKLNEGKYTVYNIPIGGERAKIVRQMNRLEIKLQNAEGIKEKRAIKSELNALKEQLPELEQLSKLKIGHCVLPKLNGSSQTIQVAVAASSDQVFKNWYLNHLQTGLSGGEKGVEDLKVFTEGNYSIFNLPFENEELAAAMSDFNTLGMNYSILPDLNIGDGNSQIAIPNADRSKLEMWFKMWKDKQLREGKEPGEMYEMNQDSYMNTSRMSEQDYVADSDQVYKDANAEFEKQSTETPWMSAMGKENSEEYIRYAQDPAFEKITINKESLVEKMQVSEKADEMRRNGYFISRIPGTYGDKQQTLILPLEQVFITDEGKTYVAFLPKNKKILTADSAGNVIEKSFEEVHQPYRTMARGMKNVEALKQGTPKAKGPNVKKPDMKAPEFKL